MLIYCHRFGVTATYPYARVQVRLMLDVASGRKTWAEQWKLHNALVLFNPAPIT
jgi:altronate dehydratase